MTHTLVLYRASPRADDKLRALVDAARESDGRVTVVALVPQESESSKCCDRRSVLWNRVCRELAHDDLARASAAVERDEAVKFDSLVFSGTGAVEALTREAVDRGADVIVVADPHASGLGALERRRLRRRSPIPVSL